MHHEVDPARFFEPPGRVEEGYARWLSRELGRDSALIWVADRAGEIEGYVYATIEERDWSMLLDDHARMHDVFVAEHARGRGLASQLVAAVIAALRDRGVTRIVLDTMTGNHAAQRLFAKLGFRPTMLEMTLTS
jgi:ribosomal protein S18 acetylase RimI-like enzyme